MVSVYDLKPRFQDVLRPLCKGLAKLGVTANQVTIVAVILSAIQGLWIIIDPSSPLPYLVMPVVLFIRMALNAIDGMLAREFDMKTPLGGILNEMGDVISDTVLYLPLALHPSVPLWPLVVVVCLSIMVEMIGVIGVQVGASRRYDGPFGKSDRAFVFGLGGIFLGLGIMNATWAFWCLVAAGVFSVVTIINRGHKTITELAADD
ncbi:MAG: hypothetical protein CMM52_03680 [Rhodospirillaceae bacterium]|mgnify:CR=1 FL=1|nr:hypothetical protein [Rhodospirillaceae bacterium]|tara:strand:+ start:4441 stop:5055 length:615 start_codon:yes stop_codon:yes gene_type:complete